MGGVSVKDVDAQKFINAYAAFLKRQGKLPMYVSPHAHRGERLVSTAILPTRIQCLRRVAYASMDFADIVTVQVRVNSAGEGTA